MKKEENNVTYFGCDDILGAALRAGRNKTERGEKNGDSLLIDFGHNVFAVADSTDRAPDASRAFLKKVGAVLNGLGLTTETEKDLEQGVTRIVDSINSLIPEVSYTDNTTFTALFVFPRHDRALLLHTGDSIFYHFRIERGEGEKVSQTNHCFVGRVDELYQVTEFHYHADSRFLLATDGFYDLVRDLRRSTNGTMEHELLALMKEQSPDRIPALIMSRYDLAPRMCDDLGFLILNPNCLGSQERISVVL